MPSDFHGQHCLSNIYATRPVIDFHNFIHHWTCYLSCTANKNWLPHLHLNHIHMFDPFDRAAYDFSITINKVASKFYFVA